MVARSFPTASATIAQLLATTIAPTAWTITRPSLGQQKEGYIGRSATEAVFLKFDTAPAAVLQRLSELGVTPRLRASGELNARPYVIQDYLDGAHPASWRWFGQHLPQLAELTRRYQTDAALHQVLAAQASPRPYHDVVAAELAALAHSLAALRLQPALGVDLAAALAELTRQARALQPVPLAPVHGDPNGLNIIITREQLYLIDWDDIHLSDPVYDCAQWLCWYVAREQWPHFFAAQGEALSQALIDRLFWWSARASFANALWHLHRQYPHEVFVRDCWDALRQQIVPHQVFAGTS